MEISRAQEMLQRVETSVGKVGLKMNSGKAKFMSYNQQDEVTIRTNDGTELEEVSNFNTLMCGCTVQSGMSSSARQRHEVYVVSSPKYGDHHSRRALKHIPGNLFPSYCNGLLSTVEENGEDQPSHIPRSNSRTLD